jgi:hypothetical protein
MASRRQQAAQKAVNAQARKNQQKQQKQARAKPVPAMKVWRQTELQSIPQRSGAAAAASAYAVGLRSGEPNVKGGFRSTRIQHRELIASIAGTSGFTVANSFSINPGLAASFPWLSTQAVGWEQYKFHKLRFCYYTRCSTATAGSMMMVPDYDAADAAPANEQIASSYRDVVEEAPWIPEVCCRLDPQAMMEPGNRKYVRTGALAANLDVKTYDSGSFFVCTTDGSATNWGKLWVEYDVEFFVPQLPPQGEVSLEQITSGGTTSSSAIFGATPTTLGNLYATVSANTITFLAPGWYLVVVRLIGSSPTITGITGTATVPTDDTGTLLTSFPVLTTAANQTAILALTGTVTGSQTYVGQISSAQYAAFE